MIRGNGFFIGPDEVILSRTWIDQQNDERLIESICSFSKFLNDEDLIETHCGGIRDFESIEDFIQYKRGKRVQRASENRKRELVVERRREFQGIRKELELALIERDGYVCAYPDCDEHLDLTIDHIVPLSKGGGDELENLRFLCRQHNSQKSDKPT